jgi:hypothetical protein
LLLLPPRRPPPPPPLLLLLLLLPVLLPMLLLLLLYPLASNATIPTTTLPAPLHPPHGQLLLVQSLRRSSHSHAVPAAAGQLRR